MNLVVSNVSAPRSQDQNSLNESTGREENQKKQLCFSDRSAPRYEGIGFVEKRLTTFHRSRRCFSKTDADSGGPVNTVVRMLQRHNNGLGQTQTFTRSSGRERPADSRCQLDRGYR